MTSRRVASLFVSSLLLAPLVGQQSRVDVPAPRTFAPDGHGAEDWAPLVVAWLAGEADAAPEVRALTAAGFVVAVVPPPSSTDELGAQLATLRQRHRIAHGAVHGVVAVADAAVPGAVHAWRHEFQSLTAIGAAAKLDLARLRPLRHRTVATLPDATPSRLRDHLTGLVAARRHDGPAGEVDRALDSFHDAAAVGDGDRYFALLPADAVFLGTDPTERWTGREFRAFALPYFERPSAWTYVPLARHVRVAPSGDLAWFDEVLDNLSYGECRGSGVLARREGRWVVLQYNLTVPVPNDLTRGLVERIRAHDVVHSRK